MNMKLIGYCLGLMVSMLSEIDAKVTEMGVLHVPQILPQYESLYEQNDDMIGYIYLKDYEYPVVQRVEDQNYYTYRDFYGEDSKEGSIFANRYTNLGEPGISLLYGHTMRSGTMFGSLKKYKKEKYFEENNIITIDTIYKEMSYQVVAVAETSLHEDFKYYEYVGDLSEEQFDEWKKGFEPYIVRGSVESLEWEDTICELNCCSYLVKDGRLVVILKAIE